MAAFSTAWDHACSNATSCAASRKPSRDGDETATAEEATSDDLPSDLPADQVFPQPQPGYVRLGPDILSPETLDDIVDLAGKVKLDESLTPRRLRAMADGIKETGSIAKQDLDDFENFVRGMRAWHKELHASYRKSGYADPKIDRDLTRSHQFLHQWDEAKVRYRIQARGAELARIGEGSPSVNPTTSAFYTYAQVSQRDMKQALALMDEMEGEPSSTISHPGNSTRMLAREEIWQAKVRLLGEAVEMAKAGHPPEIDVQYYELTSQTLLRGLAEAARAGCKVRVNMDPGRIQQKRSGDVSVDELARRVQTAYRMLDVGQEADVAFTLFPAEREIGGHNLMHQKLFRVGEKVILGGMNANSKSGENVDAAVLVEGPAARRLVEVFSRDTQLSLGARLKDIYTPEQAGLIAAGGALIGPSGFVSLLLNAAGPSARAAEAPRLTLDGSTLDHLAESAGTRLDLLLEFADSNGDGEKSGADLAAFVKKGDTPANALPLKRDGGRLLARQLKEVLSLVSDESNQQRAADIEMPLGAEQGTDLIAIADEPHERIAILLRSIATAEKFVYVPTFVMTNAVARAIIARRDELKAEGRDLDVRVVMDPGIYPDGGTPNEPAYLALEDAGIQVRWALLTRTDITHTRKIHAKEVLTDRTALMGSTNLSNKGLTTNWELGGLVEFEADDPASTGQRDHLVEDFLETWDRESIAIDTRRVAEDRLRDYHGPDKPSRLEEARTSVVFESIRLLSHYGRESTGVVSRLLAEHPELDEEIHRRMSEGIPKGYAVLDTIDEKLPPGTLREALQKTTSWQSLALLQSGRYIAA